MWDVAKAVFPGTIKALNTYIRKQKKASNR